MAKFVMSCIALALFIAAMASVNAQPGTQPAPPFQISDSI
jgi:hypothetical protein